MKYLLLFVLVFSFYGCSDETIKEKEEKVEKEAAKQAVIDKHISFGGDGTLSSPYLIGNGSYGVSQVGNTYYNITLNGSCNVLLYRIDKYPSFSLLYTNFESYDANETYTSHDYRLYDSIDSGTYAIRNTVNYSSTIDTSRFGVLSTCINDVYEYEVSTLEYGFNNFTTYSKMFTFTLNSEESLKFNALSDVDELTLFDSEFNVLHSETSVSFSKVLDPGVYYFYVDSGFEYETTINFIKN